VAIQIGIDEAGLGPNLGPYVVTATIWEVPDAQPRMDLWSTLARIITNNPVKGDSRLHLGDSKSIFQPGRGLAALERGVLTSLALCLDSLPATDRQLRERLTGGQHELGSEPWYAAEDLDLPGDCLPVEITAQLVRCAPVLVEEGIRLLDIRSAIVEPERFNTLIDVHQNKAEALSHVSLALLKYAAQLAGEQPTIAWCDKHGGRNRYDGLLSDCLDNAFVFRVRESAELSVYRIGQLEVQFLPRAESFLPVALASMVSKYIRELAMRRFNLFWQTRLPGLKPTQGYPVDARRFQAEISAELLRLEIPERLYWRCR